MLNNIDFVFRWVQVAAKRKKSRSIWRAAFRAATTGRDFCLPSTRPTTFSTTIRLHTPGSSCNEGLSEPVRRKGSSDSRIATLTTSVVHKKTYAINARDGRRARVQRRSGNVSQFRYSIQTDQPHDPFGGPNGTSLSGGSHSLCLRSNRAQQKTLMIPQAITTTTTATFRWFRDTRRI